MNENGLVEKLKASGYTQQQLADMFGVTQPYISMIFKGKRQPGKRILAGVVVYLPELLGEVIEYLESRHRRRDSGWQD